MKEKFIWEAGTPVLLVSEEERPIRSVFVGRLAESFRPGSALIMHDGPMSVNLPAKGQECRLIVRSWDRDHMNDKEYVDSVEDSWKNGFQLCFKAPQILDRSRFDLFFDSRDASQRALCNGQSIVERLENMGVPTWIEMQEVQRSAICVVGWYLDGYHSNETVPLDARGIPMRYSGGSRR